MSPPAPSREPTSCRSVLHLNLKARLLRQVSFHLHEESCFRHLELEFFHDYHGKIGLRPPLRGFSRLTSDDAQVLEL